ncbi:transposase [Streptomyces sp. NPDC059215]|uniref:transposase n=1 Tax=Streptomyces sp. NPDC059215 TaxID=3346772 RepID=UPI0036CB6F89
MTPPRSRTWGRIGQTPVVRVRGRGSGRVSKAGMSCCKSGERSRLIFSIREYRGREDEPKGFRRRDFRDLIVRARIQPGSPAARQPGSPIVLVWDHVRLHLTAGIWEFTEANAEWLTAFQVPTAAPDLNPVEWVWAHGRRPLGDTPKGCGGGVTRSGEPARGNRAGGRRSSR